MATKYKNKKSALMTRTRKSAGTKKGKSTSQSHHPLWMHLLFGIGGALLLCVGFYFFAIKPYAYRWKSCPQGKNYGVCIPCNFEVHGIDISHFQGEIDWERIRQSNLSEDNPIRFVFSKSTEGSNLRDDTFRKNFSGAHEAGLTCGAYHMFSTTTAAEQQARFFIDNVKLQSGDLPPVLDVEKKGKLSKEELQKSVLKWLSLVEQHYGVKPILYASYKFREDYLDDPSFDRYPYWIAHYYVDSVAYGKHWEFWQLSDAGSVPGIDELVDVDVFHGSQEEFTSMLIP